MEKGNETATRDSTLSRTLSAIDLTVLEMIGSGAPLGDVLNVQCRILEEQFPEMVCSVLLLQSDGETLRHGAAPTLPESYRQAIDGRTGPSIGSCASAAHRGELVIVSDISCDPFWSEHWELAQAHRLRACWSAPITSKRGKVLGAFAIYCREPRIPDPPELHLIERAARLAGIAIERKRTEDALWQAENKYRNIVENALEGIFQTTPEGGYLSVNPALARMYGYESPEELMASVEDIGGQVYVDPQRREEFKRLMEKQSVVRGFEYEVYRKDGVKIWLSENVRAVRDSNDAILYYEGMVEDITERKRVEGELKAAEAKYRALIERLPAIIYTAQFGAAGGWLYVSPQIESLLGFSPAEWTTDPGLWFRQMHPEDRDPVLALQSLCRNTGRPFDAEYRLHTRDGQVVWVRDSAAVVKDEKGDPIFLQGVVRDITERKHLEDQLRQAQKMKAIGQLAGGVAHDFNNLLMVIQGYSDVMMTHLDPAEPLRKNVEEIKKASERAASLTRQLLAFSRMQVLSPKVLDLNAVLAEMGEMLPRLIREDIELRIAAGTSLGRVRADQNQIEQVILNLVVNARDAMPSGGKLTIETAPVELSEEYARRHAGVRPGRYVMLAVSDTGVGMDSQTQARIFEPFFTTKELGKGTGLGLATVYGIVKQSNGWIWFYSEVGKGTTFKIYLPQVDEPVQTLETAKPGSLPPRGTETILVAEDQQSIRELTCEFLKASGYTVLEATDGSQALELAECYEGAIDLLLTDVVMPKMGGRELANRLSAARPQIKALYMSGYAEYSPAGHDMLDPDAIWLQKPFSLNHLLYKVREVLDARLGSGRPGTVAVERSSEKSLL
jgi:two-component system, cell cycle sensor histidine kinase and response regulator CckA